VQKDLLGHSLPGKELTDGLTKLIPVPTSAIQKLVIWFGLGKILKCLKEYRGVLQSCVIGTQL